MSETFRPLIEVSVLRRWFQKGFVVPLIYSFKSPIEPQDAYKRLNSNESFFLDGCLNTDQEESFSYIGCSPFLTFRKSGGVVEIKSGSKTRTKRAPCLDELKRLCAKYPGRSWRGVPSFTGGAVGFMSYELAREFEKLKFLSRKESSSDTALFLFVQDVLAFDLRRGRLFLIANLIPAAGRGFKRELERARFWAHSVFQLMRVKPKNERERFSIKNFRADITKSAFKRMVLKAKRYIREGDIYQANLSQRFSFEFSGSQEALYNDLRQINPSPFAGFFRTGDLCVISASPERLIQKKGDFCQTRPIAGTKPRTGHRSKDTRLLHELCSSAKERAEHLMLVDLERNDLGRVAKPHSVRVNEYLTVEKYSHVFHLVSNVTGSLRKDRDGFDLIRAMFPGGTITGCPKIRCMEIIDELEPFDRGLYTGSMGYIGFNGDLDFNIIIRTIVLQGGRGRFQVGAGIVHDSDPEAEYRETLHKGKALMEALGV